MMHAANSSSKPLIPILNLNKMPLPQEEQKNDGSKEQNNAPEQLEDLIQVDTGKLVSPMPGGPAANEVDYDMSSFASSCRYPEDDHDIDDEVDDDDEDV